MLLTLDIVSLVLAGLLGMAVGGNNLSACCGPLIGSGMVNRRTGIMIAITGYILGLALEDRNSSGSEKYSCQSTLRPEHSRSY